MPASLFLRAAKEWTCRDCGELIPRGQRYYRRRLLTLCLMCHAGAEGMGPQAGRTPPGPSSITVPQRNGDSGGKKRSRLAESKKSTPYPASFLCRGDEIGGKFIPMEVCIQADTLEAQGAVQAFLEQYGFSGGYTD